MSILFSGDFHANAANELNSITKDALIKKYQQDKFDNIKYHIILGDGGFMWPGNEKGDLSNYRILADRPFPILCVVGNHEPILGRNDIPEIDIGIGEGVYQIQAEPFIAYLKRGKIYTINGIKMLVLGGALSIDKIFRRLNVSWWKQEYWSEDEKEDVCKLLQTEKNFDCVISHTGPNHINQELFKNYIFLSRKFTDKVAVLNEEIHNKIQFHEWWCGHWHQDTCHYDRETNRRYHYLYRSTKILDKLDGKMVIYD